MCGIVGYVGWRNATEVLLEGLKALEYRGYDSSGICVHIGNGTMFCARAEGKLQNLVPKLHAERPLGSTGIGHTRWATHGKPCERNAHPHFRDGVYLVHNGIIENYLELKKKLIDSGETFTSDTDTEVFAALLQQFLDQGHTGDASFVEGLKTIRGSYAFVTVFQNDPDTLWVARSGSPLVIGVGESENMVASDMPALLAYTDRMLVLNDGEYAALTFKTIRVWTVEGHPLNEAEIEARIKKIPWTASMAQKDGYKHFMLKEIFEQPLALSQTLAGHLDSVQRTLIHEHMPTESTLRSTDFRDLTLVACGTSYHAGLVGKYFLERLAKIPTAVEQSHEFRYRDPLVTESSLVIGMSQSGETIDTLYALKTAIEKQAHTAAICNVIDASIPRLAGNTLYTRAGPEIGVASTKAFTTQLAALLILTLQLGKARHTLARALEQDIVSALFALPETIHTLFSRDLQIKHLAEGYLNHDHAFFMGRGPLYPIALEGALKLKEISYIHAEGYAAGELKHGTIALIEEDTPVIALLSSDTLYLDKILSNIEEVEARGASVIAIAPEDVVSRLPDQTAVVTYPTVPWYLEPIVSVVLLQLFAYHVADLKGTDVDQPRNLAKSVTVE